MCSLTRTVMADTVLPMAVETIDVKRVELDLRYCLFVAAIYRFSEGIEKLERQAIRLWTVFDWFGFVSIYSQTSLVRHPDKTPLCLVRHVSRIPVFQILCFIYFTPLNASPFLLPLLLRCHFKGAIYNPQQNHSSTCVNTCDFSLVLVPIFTISCLL